MNKFVVGELLKVKNIYMRRFWNGKRKTTKLKLY